MELISTKAAFKEVIVFFAGLEDDRKVKQGQKEEIAKKMLWSLMTLLGFLSYLVELRPFVISSFGAYYSGVLDGIIATIVTLSLVFYLASRVEKWNACFLVLVSSGTREQAEGLRAKMLFA